MALNKITYVDKETLNEQPSIADKNKVMDTDMNQIKSVVNAGIDALEEIIEGNVYSTTEVKTNEKFIDGKDIYRKSIVVQSLPSSAGSVQYNHNISNVDKIWIDCSNTYLANPNGEFQPYVWIHPTLIIAGFGITQTGSITIDDATTTQFRINVGQDRSTWSAVVSLRYTKTS